MGVVTILKLFFDPLPKFLQKQSNADINNKVFCFVQQDKPINVLYSELHEIVGHGRVDNVT